MKNTILKLKLWRMHFIYMLHPHRQIDKKTGTIENCTKGKISIGRITKHACHLRTAGSSVDGLKTIEKWIRWKQCLYFRYLPNTSNIKSSGKVLKQFGTEVSDHFSDKDPRHSDFSTKMTELNCQTKFE